jgi:hypothetical protein
MELRNINLYKDYQGTISGNITFGSPLGEVKLILTDENSKEILHILAKRLVEQTKEVAANMTTKIIEASGPALEDRS